MRPQQRLGALIRETGSLFTVDKAADALGVSNIEAAKICARWAKQGWLSRVKRGLYAVVPLEAAPGESMLEDAWILIPNLYAPCYVGGWSAAEYWDLTEQIFYSTCVLTSRPQAHKQQKYQSLTFFVKKVQSNMLFGTEIVWINETKVQISDPHKTIIDMLYDPQLGGGIQHTIDCIKEYFKSDRCDFEKLVQYAKRMNKGAVLKRLGFIAEMQLGEDHLVTSLCRRNLSKGYIYIDPKLKIGSLITRWNLFVPDSIRRIT